MNREKKKEDGMNSFAATAYWRVLNADDDAVAEPTNPTFSKPRAPTIEEQDADFVPVKHNFSERFERPQFKGEIKKIMTNRRGVPMKGKDNKHFSDAGADKKSSAFETPKPEKKITQEMRQEAFDSWATTDDHGMHATGILKDQNGTKYFIIKNSWGTKYNDCDGFIYILKYDINKR